MILYFIQKQTNELFIIASVCCKNSLKRKKWFIIYYKSIKSVIFHIIYDTTLPQNDFN